MIKFIEEKIENESMQERNNRVERIMNNLIWGNPEGTFIYERKNNKDRKEV